MILDQELEIEAFVFVLLGKDKFVVANLLVIEGLLFAVSSNAAAWLWVKAPQVPHCFYPKSLPKRQTVGWLFSQKDPRLVTVWSVFRDPLPQAVAWRQQPVTVLIFQGPRSWCRCWPSINSSSHPPVLGWPGIRPYWWTVFAIRPSQHECKAQNGICRRSLKYRGCAGCSTFLRCNLWLTFWDHFDQRAIYQT